MMVHRLVAFCFVNALIWMGCSAPGGKGCDEEMVEIQRLEKALLQGGEELDADLRAQLMKAYAAFANSCHEHEFTPEALFRRADLLRSAGKFQEAMTQLRDVHDHYADYEKRSVCAFLVGFIAEVELNDREQAKKTYQQVIEVHPDSEVAIWARQSLENLEVKPGQ